MGRGDGPRSPNAWRRGDRGDSSKNSSTTGTVRGHRARSSMANSEASSMGIGLPSLGAYRRGATKEPRKRGLLVCCSKAYSRGQKRWSSLTAPEEDEEVAWGLGSREEEAQVRQLACEGLGMTDAEVGRFVKAFQSVAMDHAIDVPAFLELAQMCDSHGEGPHAPLARALFLYYHNQAGGGLSQSTPPPRPSIHKEAVDVTQRLSAVDDAVPQSFHDPNSPTVEAGVALMNLPLFLLTVEALVWDCYTRRDVHRPGFDGSIMSEEACTILLHHLMGVRHSSDRRGSKATPESSASVVEMLAVVRQGDKRLLNNTHITKSMLTQFLRTKPVILAPVLRLQQCLAMAISGTSSKGQAFWDWVQDARSRCLSEEQAMWPHLAQALLPPSSPPPFVITMDRGAQGCRGSCEWWVACLMSSLCCLLLPFASPYNRQHRQNRQNRRPHSSTIAPSPLHSTANNTSTNKTRRSLSGASSPSHAMSPMSTGGQGLSEGVSDVASETLRSSGRLSRHTTTSSPKTERDRAHKESLAQLLDSSLSLPPPSDPSTTQAMHNSMRMTSTSALHSNLTVTTGLSTTVAAPNRFAALNTPSSPEGRHQSPLGSPSHKQAQAFLNSTLQNSQRLNVEDRHGSTTYK